MVPRREGIKKSWHMDEVKSGLTNWIGRYEEVGQAMEKAVELAEKKDKENTKQHYSEVFYGSFTREFILPTSAEKEAIKAHYENGILSITVPKSAKSKAQTIKID